MRAALFVPILLCSVVGMVSCTDDQTPTAPTPNPDSIADLFAAQAGPYLGQSLPGLTPEVFAPALVSTTGDQAGVVVYPGGREIYYWSVIPGQSTVRTTILVTRERNGAWTAPEPVPFSGTYMDGYPAIHPDGSRMYFQSNRPIDPAESTYEYNLWYVEREGDDWSEPRSMGRPINGPNHTGGASVTNDGTLYFTLMDLDSGEQKIYRSELLGGLYQEPERLPDAVNSHFQACDSYVAPDEGYLLFTAFQTTGHVNNPGGLYISFRNQDGNWSDSEQLPTSITTESQTGSATISTDGLYLFFPADNSAQGTGMDILWLRASALGDGSNFD